MMEIEGGGSKDGNGGRWMMMEMEGRDEDGNGRKGNEDGNEGGNKDGNGEGGIWIKM